MGAVVSGCASAERCSWLLRVFAGYALAGYLLLPACLAYYVVVGIRRPFFYKHLPAMPLSKDSLPRYWPHYQDPLIDFGIPFEGVHFPASDGCTLRGWYIL